MENTFRKAIELQRMKNMLLKDSHTDITQPENQHKNTHIEKLTKHSEGDQLTNLEASSRKSRISWDAP